MSAVPELARLEGKYEIVKKLREGGMGAIYLVRHRLLEEFRVIKVIRPQLEADEGLKERFLREARSAVRLRHPNIAQIYDFTMAEDGSAFMVMEFIDGEDLARRLQQRGKIGVGLALEVGIQTLRALDYLHRQRFVHRDISPDNLMLTRDVDGRVLVKLIDLGIAKPLESARTNLTQEGFFLGKIKYASPEQFRGGGVSGLDQRSDLYSLGIVLYEVLTGSHPIPGKSSEALVAGHLFQPPLAFSQSDSEARLPEPLRQAILKSLEKDPDKRHATAEEFARALQEIQAEWSEPEEGVGEDFSQGGTLTQALEESEPGGTTQSVLDEFFAPVRTAPPIAPAPGLPRGRDSNAARLSSLVGESERLAAGGATAPTVLSSPPKQDSSVATVSKPAIRGAPRRRLLFGVVAGAAAVLVAGVVLFWPDVEPTAGTELGEAGSALGEPAPILPTSEAAVPPADGGEAVVGLLARARAAYADARDDDAIDGIRAVQQIDPQNADARQLLGVMLEAARSRVEREQQAADRAGASRLAAAGWDAAERSLQRGEARLDAEPLAALGDYQSASREYAAAAAEAVRAQLDAEHRQRADVVESRPATPRQESSPPPSSEVSPSQTEQIAVPPVDETPAIRRVLEAFSAAHENLDIGALQRIWPTLSGQRLNAMRGMFENARQIVVKLSECEIVVNGNSARADCSLRQVFDPKHGTSQQVNRDIRITLRKNGERWLVEDY